MEQPSEARTDANLATRSYERGSRSPPGEDGNGLTLLRASNNLAALGAAVNLLMGMPAFSGRRFGEWSRILVGQINRGHYRFVVDADRKIVGFVGWAETSEDMAERWLRATGPLPDLQAAEGDCMVLNAWASRSPEATRFLFRALRRIGSGKKAVFFKRFYSDGRVRPFRMEANRRSRQEHGERMAGDLPQA